MEGVCRCSWQCTPFSSFATTTSNQSPKSARSKSSGSPPSASGHLPLLSSSNQRLCPASQTRCRGIARRLRSAFLSPWQLALKSERTPARWRSQKHGVVRSLAKEQRGGSSQKEPELDVAVFRFTLGIPGVEDALLPRILGCLVGVLLVGNHLATPAPIADAQLRSEALGAILAVLACIVPSISRRLQEGKGGRRASPDELDGTSQRVFALDPTLPDVIKQQLAWTTYSLLKNTRTNLVLISDGRRVVCARGAVSASMPTPLLQLLTESLEEKLVKEVLRTKRYLSDRGALSSAGVDRWSFVPSSVRSACFQAVPSPSNGTIMLFSDEDRFLLPKDRIWVEGLASRLFASEHKEEPSRNPEQVSETATQTTVNSR
ncbi:hypothetical protein KFL_003790110 [Klebsormidium nitens]|uniref:CCB4 n=1 Tax=Klebsormidium nitens TaxID=105231 RepID=A0A1Y1IB91_KLENI|nr:hypothetical protein KFL_003790110 [Klebsormidium nitens]|eukprot:GAQ87823.1 hypothetical protein KFL_003790110 [Klebsormidium nitens]